MNHPRLATGQALTGITDVHIHVQPWRELKPHVLETMWRGQNAHRDLMIQVMDDNARAARGHGPFRGLACGPGELSIPRRDGFSDATNASAAQYAQADPERMKLGEVVTHAPALGKEPTVVQDSPGFASSRLGKGLYSWG